MSPDVAFALAAAAHAGFQVTVTVLVYPALVEIGRAGWTVAHERHSRRIVAIVAVVYAALLATGVRLLLAGPDVLGWVALAATAGALAVTALAAAPLHGRLGPDDDALRRRLLVVDRVRCAAAVAGAVAAVCAVV